MKEVAVFGAATETFSRRNIGCSIPESMERFSAVVQRARDEGLDVRGYISCVLGCPYEVQLHLRFGTEFQAHASVE